MPLHDWTRLPAFAFHDFHGRWIYAIRDALNAGLLPSEYYARAEQVVGDIVPDVLGLKARSPRDGHPDVAVGNPAADRLSVAVAPPRVRVTEVGPPVRRSRRRVAIHHRSMDQVVALVELVSAGNKAAAEPFRAIVRKAVDAVRDGVHVLLVDPFPPGPRDPAGLHAVVWRRLVGRRYTPPPDKPLTLVAYEARPEGPRCYVEPLAAGDRLADMPLFLVPGEYVNVPLEATYQAALAHILPQDRAALEAGPTA